MRKVKQMFRLAVGRIAAPQFKVVAHHRNIISFGKIAKAFPKYFPTSQNLSAPPAEEAVNAQKLNAFQADKFGLLNLGKYFLLFVDTLNI